CRELARGEDEGAEHRELTALEALSRTPVEGDTADAKVIGCGVRSQARGDPPNVLPHRRGRTRGGGESTDAVEADARCLFFDRLRAGLLELVRRGLSRNPRKHGFPTAAAVAETLRLAPRMQLPTRRLRPDEELQRDLVGRG